LIHRESFPTRVEAMEKERYYKTGRGREELDQIKVDHRSDSPHQVGAFK
jgi:hypothetical protein